MAYYQQVKKQIPVHLKVKEAGLIPLLYFKL